ncbi:MAG TPA: nickel pincer cofactor biosynthesis protein LarB [Candidatus Thermoplasmatota archaeon]|nr:nickel pincer cofactor biosynthesis protein LarB [Candidatus Thermoplasmatota archaeon]
MPSPVTRPDLDRAARTGVPEVILAEGKEDEHLRAAVEAFASKGGRVLVSRLEASRLGVLEGLPYPRTYHALARILVVGEGGKPVATGGRVGILTGGTADARVADEARIVLEELGCEVRIAYDVGVAGIHRLFGQLDWLPEMDVIIVAAGREGALAAVVSGLTDRPVIGLPVSMGYGMGGRGEAALLGMLQSCSPLAVVNIDAGFVAAAHAAKIANAIALARRGVDRQVHSISPGGV